MNIKIRGRIWQIFRTTESWWHFGSGTYPAPDRYPIFDWWILGPLEIRRFRRLE